MSRAKRVASRDVGQLVRAVASLVGLAVAIALAVGLGSMMGGSDRRIPVAQEPVPGSGDATGSSTGRVAGDALDELFGAGGSDANATAEGSGGTERPSTSTPSDPTDDVDLPDGDLPGPVEVPVTPIPDVDIQGVIDDLTEVPSGPGEDLLGGLDDTVGDLVGGLDATVDGLLRGD